MFNKDATDNSTYNVENFEFIKKTSPVVGELIEKEYNRQKNNIELIASENYCSEEAAFRGNMQRVILMCVLPAIPADITAVPSLSTSWKNTAVISGERSSIPITM